MGRLLLEGWGDWLGSGRQATKDRMYWPFDKSKKYVQKVGLKNEKEWREYTKSGKLPATIPAAPHSVYKEEWIGIGDWLGTGNIAPHKKQFMSFPDASLFVKKLNLKSQNEWKNFCFTKTKSN